jgi:cytochrome P450
MSSAATAYDTPRPKLTAGDVDLSALEYFDDPYKFYAHLRRTQPVAPVPQMNAWLLTRYADVKAAWLDERLQVDYERLQVNRMGPGVVNETFFKFGRLFMVFADPPHQPEVKQLFVQGFTRVRAQRYLPIMREIVNEVADDLVPQGRGDIIMDFTRRVPLRLISTILGVPREDQEALAQWIDDYHPVIGFPPMTPEQTAVANAASDGMDGYFRSVVEDRRRNPGSDLISEILAVNAARDEPIDDMEIVANLFILYHAGQETTKYQVGNALVQLHRHPDQLAYLLEDPTRVWDHVDEILRYDSISQIVGRVAMEDLEISGQQIGKGQTVLLGIGASNRDPEIFADPDRFDLKRSNARQNMVFGGGHHTCLGNGLARLSIPLSLEVILTRFRDLRIDFDGLVQMHTLPKRGFHSIPATWTP